MHCAPVTSQNFDDLAALFESRGGPDYCWCMAWRTKDKVVTRTKGAEGKALRKAALHARVERGEAVGILAYDGDLPVGWVSCGPLGSFARLGGPKDADPGKTWAISCFYVARPYRGQGLMLELIRQVAEAAREAGAQVLQTYGVARTSPSYRFMGLIDRYLALGFEEVGMAGSRRHVMRLVL